MRSSFALAALLSASLFGAACAAPTDEASAPPGADSEDVTSSVSTKALVKGNSAFASDMYGEIAKTSDNVFFSPYSISAALGMTYAGAKSGTAAAMKGTMHFPSGNVHTAFKGLAAELAKRERVEGVAPDQQFHLSVANSLWGEKTQHFETSFTKLLKDDYGAGLEAADFLHKAEAERVRINGWVEDETHDKIKDLLPQGILKSDTKLVLVNAIYFKAAWSHPFTKAATDKEKFTTMDGAKVDVDMMNAHRRMFYAGDASYDAVALPYQGGDVEMVAIAPKAGKLDAFERGLDGATIDGIRAKMDIEDVSLHLPKFKIAGASVKLKESLTKLGMGVAFTDDANLSGITGRNDTKISDVVHKAFIDLDEKGTEAAAATAVIVVSKTAIRPGRVIDVRFDRPFLFVIRDVPTGAILFMGRVANPKG